MSDSPENFDQLRKAMKLAKYEVPPPGYFNNFSSKIIGRIERQGYRAASQVDQLTWMRRFLRALETNSLAAGAFGFTVCGLLIAGIAWSEYQEPVAADNSNLQGTDVASAGNSQGAATLASLGVDHSTTASLNPTLNTNIAGSMFGGFDQLNVQQVNYTAAH